MTVREARGWVAATLVLLTAIMLSPLILLEAAPAAADARSEYLIRLLQGSTQFRVRAQAAISLGGVDNAPEVVEALTRALKDEHPAVRAAAANSLGRVADPRAIPALRSAASDPEAPVEVAAKAAIARIEAEARHRPSETAETAHAPAGPARFYVALGKPGSRSANITSADLERASQILRERLTEIDGVVLAPSDESTATVRGVLRSRKLKGFYIDSSVTSLEPKSGGVRAAVSVIVATYPDRAMRAIMQGAATATGGGDIKAQAMEGALKSALSQLPQAMARD